MKLRSILLAGGLLAVSAGAIYTATLTDTTRGIQKLFPSARVSIHHAHSPDPQPILDLMRLLRGRSFIPPSEWVSVSIEAEPSPVSLASLHGFRVAVLHLRRCRVTDISQLRSGMYAEFVDCDFSSLPAQQTALLWQSPNSPPNRLERCQS